MKKFFFYCISMLMLGTVGAQAQIVTDEELDETFQFVDELGNVVANGSTIVVTELNSEGQMVVPLYVKNVSGEKAAVSMYEDISQKPNGGWQTCAFGNCMNLSASGYSSKNIMAADFNGDIQTEWMPEEGQYATWEAKLQIHIFNITKKSQFAQIIETAGNEIIGYGPTVTIRFEYKDPDAQEETKGTLIMGPYTTDDLATQQQGLGFNMNADLSVASYIPVEDVNMFNGGTVVKFRVGLAASATISRVFISGINASGNVTDIISEEVSGNKAGWNEFELGNPSVLDFSGYAAIFIGYDYKQTSGAYPLSIINAGSTIYPVYAYGNFSSNGLGWYSLGTGYGNLSIQCYVESNSFPKQDIIVKGLMTDKSWFKAGDQLGYSLTLQNFGIADINNCAFNVEVDDVAVSTLTVDEAIKSVETKTLNGTLKLADNLQNGTHKLGLRLQTVDGAAPTGNLNDDYISTTFNVYEQSVARQKNLLEQFTSQYCTYCPRGVTFFSDLISQRDDIAWVSVHGNMSSGNDIFTIEAGDTISYYEGVTGFPSASFNRTFIPDFADSEDEIAYGLGYDMSYRNQVVQMFSQAVDYTAEAPSFVTLAINQVYNPETRELKITVNGEGVDKVAELLSNYGITVMLTENGLTGRQLNEGRWVSNFEHHYVLRATLGKCTGNTIKWEGDNFTANFSYTIPESYVKDNMYIVAFVAPIITLGETNTVNMAVNNCEMVAVKDAVSAVIRSIVSDGNAESRYSLDGRQLPEATKGLNIVRMSDGSVRKVVIK